jgi:transposase
MTESQLTLDGMTLVAIDIAKDGHDVLIEPASGSRRRRFRMANTIADYQRLADYLRSTGAPVLIGFEATGNYHRSLAFFLDGQGFTLRLIPTLALARTREAMNNSWDKNDPRDAQVILHLLKTGLSQTWCDPLLRGTNDAQELSKTHHQVTLARTRVWHQLRNHYFTLYFPEIERFIRGSEVDWLVEFLRCFPTPGAITELSLEQFTAHAWNLVGRRVAKTQLLAEIYATAQRSVGVPVELGSSAIAMFRLVLEEYLNLSNMRHIIARRAAAILSNSTDAQRLMTIPGIGPATALTIMAEAGNLRRFVHCRQFLTFCGMNLSTQQSGRFRGQSRLSKYGNARLRTAFWIAAQSAVRMRDNSFRRKFERYVRNHPSDVDLRRKAYVAVAAKLARVAHGLIKTESDYRPFFEEAIPGG